MTEVKPDQAIRLVEARIAKGFKTARSAAEYYGWNYHTYLQHERGIRGLPRVAKRYAKAFGVSEGWLLTGEGAGIKGKSATELSNDEISHEIVKALNQTTPEKKKLILDLLKNLNNEEE